MARLIVLVPLVLLLTTLGAVIYSIFLVSPPPLPELDLEAWWGPEKLKSKEDTSIRPFKIAFKPNMIIDLRQLLKNTRLPAEPLEGIAFEYGFNGAQLANWLEYWGERYPFEERVKLLNRYQHYKTKIQGLKIHFFKVDPEVPPGVEVVPLLLLHGWPGSVREMYDAIPILTARSDKRDFVIQVIVPSLPGYGFSEAAVRPGLGAAEVAVVFRNLMQRLGYKQYYVQGGDWGAIIGSFMATLFPKEVLGFHTNMAATMSSTNTLLTLLGSIYPPMVVEQHLADRMYPLSKIYSFLLEETGYMHLHATKPDTIGVALLDSPAGLLAYILEKFSTWTHHDNRGRADGGLEGYDRDALIDNLMIYWSTDSITTSMRLYAETFSIRHSSMRLDVIPTEVPTWVIQARYELSYQPPFMLRSKFPNLLNVTVLDNGGHFLAFELPQVFADDVIKAIGHFREWRKENNIKTEL